MLTSLAQSLQFLSPTPLTRLLIVGLSPHFLPQTTSLAQLSETAHRLLNGLSGSNP